MKIKATWKNKIIAESEQTEYIEGNHYFPPNQVKQEYLQKSETKTFCSWKGVASYYNVIVDGIVTPDAAWYYPSPKNAASNITGYIAFWKGIDTK